jgi:HlyD family secretion protein
MFVSSLLAFVGTKAQRVDFESASQLPPRDPPRRRRWRPWLGLVMLLVAVIAAVTYLKTRKEKTVRYVSSPIARGTVTMALTATGTVNPVTVVEVGTYVSGTIQRWYCDYNTPVTVGYLCAQIDPRPFQVVADQAVANLAVAKAQLAKDRATLAYAKVTYERDVGLLGRGIVSQATVDSDKSVYDQDQAQILYDESAIDEKQAELNAANVNLGYTKIISPVKGTVVSRAIEVGQTVAASFQTPILFLIATNLTKMQVDTNVSESDVGGVKVGNKATFTVQAYPGRIFHGTVRQVRQAPNTVQNVVTFDVVVSVDNPDGALMPGMTATTRIIKAERSDVLTVPQQALRYRPGGRSEKRSADAAAPGDKSVGAAGDKAQRGRIWLLRAGQPVPVQVTTGLDDGGSVEVLKGDLQAGDQVIVSEVVSDANAGAQQQGAPRFLRFGGR